MYTIEDPIKRTITYLVDTFIYILYICLQLCGKTTPIKGPLDTLSFRKILVIRIDHIGDVLLTTPVHSALKERYPKAKIYSMVGSWAACIHNHNPHIDATIVYDAPWWKRERSNARFRLNDIFDLIRVVRLIRTEKFDLVIDPRGDFRHLFFFGYCTNAKYLLSYNRSGGKYLLSHAVNYDRYLNEIDKNFTLLAPLGIKNVQKNTDVFISKDETQWCNNFLSDHNLQNKLIVIISPGSRLQLKMLPIEKFISLSSWLIEQCHNVAIVYIGAKKMRTYLPLLRKI
ncbi:MAG: glycosyltransferase family 9 protein [Candidatus Omnitrophota bacterium]